MTWSRLSLWEYVVEIRWMKRLLEWGGTRSERPGYGWIIGVSNLTNCIYHKSINYLQRQIRKFITFMTLFPTKAHQGGGGGLLLQVLYFNHRSIPFECTVLSLEPRPLYMFCPIPGTLSSPDWLFPQILASVNTLYFSFKFKIQCQQHFQWKSFSSSNLPTPTFKTMRIFILIFIVLCHFSCHIILSTYNFSVHLDKLRSFWW